jgi:hypothetical protein
MHSSSSPMRTSPRPLLALRTRAVRTAGGVGTVALAVQLLTGCYTYAPVDVSLGVPTQREVAVDITDRGRFELGGAIGQSPARIEGRLLAASDTTLTLAVSNVQALGGATTPWAGEPVTVRRTGVAGVRQRKLSASRTALLVGAIAGAVALVFTAGLAIAGGGDDAGGDTGGGGGGES